MAMVQLSNPSAQAVEAVDAASAVLLPRAESDA